MNVRFFMNGHHSQRTVVSAVVLALVLGAGLAAQERNPGGDQSIRTLPLTLEDAVRRAVENNPELAIVRLETEAEAARVGESRTAFTPVFSTSVGRSSTRDPAGEPAARRARRRRQRLVLAHRRAPTSTLGFGNVERVVGRVAHDLGQPVQQLRSEPAVGVPGRLLAAAAQGPRHRHGATAGDHREEEPAELGPAVSRSRRADGCRGEAGLLDVQGVAGERHRSAAVARAGAGARAREQGAGRCGTDSAARSRPGRSRGGAATREPDPRKDAGGGFGGRASSPDRRPGRRVVLASSPRSD